MIQVFFSSENWPTDKLPALRDKCACLKWALLTEFIPPYLCLLSICTPLLVNSVLRLLLLLLLLLSFLHGTKAGFLIDFNLLSVRMIVLDRLSPLPLLRSLNRVSIAILKITSTYVYSASQTNCFQCLQSTVSISLSLCLRVSRVYEKEEEEIVEM